MESKLFHSLSNESVSCVWLFATPWTVAHQAPLSMVFSRHEYWSGLPFPSPGDLPDSGVKSRSPASSALQAGSLPFEPPGKPHWAIPTVYFGNSVQSLLFKCKHLKVRVYFFLRAHEFIDPLLRQSFDEKREERECFTIKGLKSG